MNTNKEELDIREVIANIDHMRAQTLMINTKLKWYWVVLASVVSGAVVAAINLAVIAKWL